MHRQQILSSGIILGTLLVFSLVVAGVMQHRASVQGSGIGLLWMDVALLVLYGFAGMIVWKLRALSSITAAMAGAQIGLMLGAVEIANHLIEAFVPTRPFVLVISPVLLTLALLGTSGAAVWERTGSLVLALIGGVYCAIVATLITLCFAISFNLFFAAHVDWQLREAFAASGMIDRAGFRVRNILEASSEILVRLPILAACLALVGAAIHVWMSGSRRILVVTAGFMAPVAFVVGASALWHANGIERAARPPFVMSGVLLTGIALSAAYPIWSVLHASRGSPRGAADSKL